MPSLCTVLRLLLRLMEIAVMLNAITPVGAASAASLVDVAGYAAGQTIGVTPHRLPEEPAISIQLVPECARIQPNRAPTLSSTIWSSLWNYPCWTACNNSMQNTFR